MNADGSIAEFFYNIVPGSLFILLLYYFQIFNVFKFLPMNGNTIDSALFIFFDIALGLFAGFVFQGITKIIRDFSFKRIEPWNEVKMEEVKMENKEQWAEIINKFKIGNISLGTKTVLYQMDSYLRKENPAFLVNHFSSRFAFWTNIFLASFSLLILRLIVKQLADIDSLLIGLVFCFSYFMTEKHLFAYYDSIFKSYYMGTKKFKI